MKSMLLALGGLLLASAAHAQTPAPNPDTNGDGQVTRPEYLAFNARVTLAATDSDRDGKVSKSEARTVMGARGAMIDLFWGRVDTNHDGFLTRPEMDTMATANFDRADTNHDGVLSQAEIDAARARGRRR